VISLTENGHDAQEGYSVIGGRVRWPGHVDNGGGAWRWGASRAAASVPGWPAACGMMVSVAADSTTVMVVVSAIATSGTALDSASSHMVTMTTTLTMTRMALIRMPTTMGTMTTAVAMWFSDVSTPRIVGACAPSKYAVELLHANVGCI
jgi:hypothetical protein